VHVHFLSTSRPPKTTTRSARRYLRNPIEFAARGQWPMGDGTGKEKGIYNDNVLSKPPSLELNNDAIRLAQTRRSRSPAARSSSAMTPSSNLVTLTIPVS
jgi:hypothetical protein